MTTVTQQVILQVLEYTGQTTIPTPNFSVAYLPMNTGLFTIDASQAFMIMVVGFLGISIQAATGRIIGEVISEPHELKLK